MATNALISRQNPPRNTSTDFAEGYEFVRNITATETALDLDPGDYSAIIDNAFQPGHCSLVSLRLWADASGAAPTIRIVEFPKDGPLAKPNSPVSLSQAKGRHLFVGTLTFSGSTTANVNPAHGEADSGTTWYELSNHTDTFVADDRVNFVPDASASSYEMEILIDVQGAKCIYVYATAKSGSENLVVAARRVQ